MAYHKNDGDVQSFAMAIFYLFNSHKYKVLHLSSRNQTLGRRWGLLGAVTHLQIVLGYKLNMNQ